MFAYNKAIVAFITPMIVTLLIPFGITGDTTISSAVNIILTAILTGVSVYLIPNKS